MFGGIEHASLWNGTAASRVDLHPMNANGSSASAISGGKQAGYVGGNGATHASLWSGTAASWVNLHPAGAFASYIADFSGTNQVGGAKIGGVNGVYHASLWSGSAASWVDLNPAGGTQSAIHDAFGGQQAGWASVGGGGTRASLWSGTAASWEDLSLALSGSWINTVANSIWSDGTTTYVAGSGFNLARSEPEALLWTRVVPEGGTVGMFGIAALGLAAARRGRPARARM